MSHFGMTLRKIRLQHGKSWSQICREIAHDIPTPKPLTEAVLLGLELRPDLPDAWVIAALSQYFCLPKQVWNDSTGS
jgi:hypothetical protein